MKLIAKLTSKAGKHCLTLGLLFELCISDDTLGINLSKSGWKIQLVMNT